MFAPLLEVKISKKYMPLWRKTHFKIKILKPPGFGPLLEVQMSLRFAPIQYTTLHFTPQHYNYNHTTTLHYLPLNYTTLSPLKLAPWGQTPLYIYRMGALKKAYKMDGHQEFAWIQNGRAQSEP